jgi:hypothetical protein
METGNRTKEKAFPSIVAPVFAHANLLLNSHKRSNRKRKKDRNGKEATVKRQVKRSDIP